MMQGVSLPQQVSYHGARLAIGLAILAPTIALLCSPWPYLAVMPGLLAMGAVVFAVRPQWMFAAILLLIPFGAFRGPLQKILAFGLLLLVVLQAVRDRTFPSEWKSHLWPLLLAFLCVNILSAVLSPYRANSIDNIILLATALLFFALGLRYLAHKDIFHHLPAIIGISVSLSALLAVMGFLFDIRMFLDDSEVFKRGLGGSGSAPSLAGLVIFGMPFLLHGLVSAKTAPVRVGWFIMMLMSLGGLVTTYSRGGALVCGGWLLYTIGKSLLRCPPRRLGLVLSGGAVLLVGVVCVIPPSYWERQVSLANPEDRSLSRRTTYLKIGAEAVAERPILGHGPGAFRKIYGASTWSLHFKGTKQHTLERYAHNSYVEVLVGTGFLGLAVFLLIPVTALWDLTRARRCALQAGEEPLASMLSAGRAALFCLLIYLLIYSSVYDKFLWVGIALSQVVLVRMPQREQHI